MSHKPEPDRPKLGTSPKGGVIIKCKHLLPRLFEKLHSHHPKRPASLKPLRSITVAAGKSSSRTHASSTAWIRAWSRRKLRRCLAHHPKQTISPSLKRRRS